MFLQETTSLGVHERRVQVTGRAELASRHNRRPETGGQTKATMWAVTVTLRVTETLIKVINK
jgi:hypothetical protein